MSGAREDIRGRVSQFARSSERQERDCGMSEAEAKPINMQRNRLFVTLCSEEPASERTNSHARHHGLGTPRCLRRLLLRPRLPSLLHRPARLVSPVVGGDGRRCSGRLLWRRFAPPSAAPVRLRTPACTNPGLALSLTGVASGASVVMESLEAIAALVSLRNKRCSRVFESRIQS